MNLVTTHHHQQLNNGFSSSSSSQMIEMVFNSKAINHQNLHEKLHKQISTTVDSIVTASNYSDLFEIPENLQLTFSIVYNSISFLSVIGNLFIILAVLKCKQMHNVTNYFITNLAIADIIVSLFATPFQYKAAILQFWKWPSIICKLAPFATTLNVNVSIFTLVAITVDRSYIILYPLKPKLRTTECVKIISFIWLLALLLSSVNLFHYNIVDVQIESNASAADSTTFIVQQKCGFENQTFHEYYMLILTIIQFLLPIVVFAFTYTAIYTNLTYKQTPHSPNSNISQNRKRKVIKMIFIVLLIFIVCWSPLQIYNFLQFIYPKINEYYYINLIWLCANGLAMSNSCYNVVIYGICSTRYKNQFRRMLNLKRKLTNSNMNTANFNNNTFTNAFFNSFVNINNYPNYNGAGGSFNSGCSNNAAANINNSNQLKSSPQTPSPSTQLLLKSSSNSSKSSGKKTSLISYNYQTTTQNTKLKNIFTSRKAMTMTMTTSAEANKDNSNRVAATRFMFVHYHQHSSTPPQSSSIKTATTSASSSIKEPAVRREKKSATSLLARKCSSSNHRTAKTKINERSKSTLENKQSSSLLSSSSSMIADSKRFMRIHYHRRCSVNNGAAAESVIFKWSDNGVNGGVVGGGGVGDVGRSAFSRNNYLTI